MFNKIFNLFGFKKKPKHEPIINNGKLTEEAVEKGKIIYNTLLASSWSNVKVDLLNPVDFSNFIFEFYEKYGDAGFNDKKLVLDHIKKIAELNSNPFIKRYFLEVHQNNMLRGYRENENIENKI